MKTLAALALALLLGAGASPAAARDAHARPSANGVGTTTDSVTGRIQSTSPQASDEGKAAVDAHTRKAVRAAGRARAGNDAPAATGAGEAIRMSDDKAKRAEDPRPSADSGSTADAAGGSEPWPGKDVDSSEIT